MNIFCTIFDIFWRILKKYFDAVSSRDDPTVGKKRSSTLVFELASLVLPQ